MLTPQERRKIGAEINALKGQLDGLQKAYDDEQDLRMLLQQFKAVEGRVTRSVHVVLDELFRKSLAESLVRAQNECPGECDYCDRIEQLKGLFKDMNLHEVVEHLSHFPKNTT